MEEKIIDSKFRKVIIASKRAKQILNGSLKKVDVDARNPLTVALAEIEAGYIDIKNDEETEMVEALESEEMLSAEEVSSEVTSVLTEEQE